MTTLIDATISGANSNSYLTRDEADSLMDGYPQLDKWDSLDQEAQERILIVGTRKIDGYKSWGPSAVSTQRLTFPRAIDDPAAIPREVIDALMEFVDSILDGRRTPILDLKSEGVLNSSIGGQSMTFDKADPSELPAGSRRMLDRLYNASWSEDAVVNRELDGSTDPNSFFG